MAVKKQYLNAAERAEANRRFPNRKCSIAKDKYGFYAYTHRARSDSHKSLAGLTKKEVDFVSSTS